MALIYQAEIRPSKLELITDWAPTQPWFEGDADAEFTLVASYRFDDPEGEVGIETLLVRAGDGPILQVPLTYRGAPLPGGDAWFITTMEHSVLGQRWIYDASGDPAYLAAVATAALAGGTEAEHLVEVDGKAVLRPSSTAVRGSGGLDVVVTPPPIDNVSMRQKSDSTVVDTGDLRFVVGRVVGAATAGPKAGTPRAWGAPESTAVLTGTWTDQPEPRILVSVSVY